MKFELIFPILKTLCRTLEENNIRYFLAGGTLLGAVRDGEIIKHDKDFDIDILAEDEARVLALAECLEHKGVTIRKKSRTGVRTLEDGSVQEYIILHSNITVFHKTQHAGDISVFTIFNDGIARRLNNCNMLYNAKMSIPAWYYEQSTPVYLHGEQFSAPRSPELILRKIYGEDWQTPLKPGQYAPGRHVGSGSVPDADIEMLIRHALEHGWDGDYSERPVWPPANLMVRTKLGRRWARRHEPLLNKSMPDIIKVGALPKLSPFQTESYLRLAASKGYQIGVGAQDAAIEKLRLRQRRANKRLHRILQRNQALEQKLEKQAVIVTRLKRKLRSAQLKKDTSKHNTSYLDKLRCNVLGLRNTFRNFILRNKP